MLISRSAKMSNVVGISPRKTGTIDGYTYVPDSFLDNSNISWDVKSICIYLQSFPDAWMPMPDKIQSRFRLSKAKWKKIYHELIEGGYVRLNNGIEGHRKPFLEFDIYGGLK